MKRLKKPGDSETIMTEVVCPNDTNPMGFLQGGRLMQWMDIGSAVCAQSHAGTICVTASIDEVKFKLPARIGDVISIKAKITRAFSTSMEIFVQAWSKKITSSESQLINEAFFTFVAIDDQARPVKVPPVHPQSKTEKLLFEGALKRKEYRIHTSR
ncbi:MAG: thioesterase superfamily protein [Bacteroidetes bacterium]|nr:MAG: thioesterase superfamily protein [Bacteroidota bacterium]